MEGTVSRGRVLMQRRIEAESKGLPELFPVLSSSTHLPSGPHVSLCDQVTNGMIKGRYFVPISVNLKQSPQPSHLTSPHLASPPCTLPLLSVSLSFNNDTLVSPPIESIVRDDQMSQETQRPQSRPS